jgi:kumamolisin
VALMACGMHPAGARGQAPIATLGADAPAPVAQRLAVLRAPHAPGDVLSLNVGLAVREPAALEQLIQAAATPGGSAYGHYLTQAQYLARFAPTAREVSTVTAWLESRGLQVEGAAHDNSLLHLRASTAAIERAFALGIGNYSFAGREFYANDRAPSVPADLHVRWVSGLSDYQVAKAATTCVLGVCGYDGEDFRAAYGLSGDGAGQTVGFTLWGKGVPQSDYTEYAKNTGTTQISVGTPGPDGLDFIEVGGPSALNEAGEVALDTENAHGVAPGIHETYWLGHDSSATTLETVLDEAASSGIAVISNSWYLIDACEVDQNMETALEHGAATGKTFYFATADFGAQSGCTYPSVSQYAVAVGGTELEVGAGGTWASERAFNNDGGCSNSEPRPSWQTGIGSPLMWPSTSCTGRATPDVSADSCFSTEGSGVGCWSYVFFGGVSSEFGGTSLATPIWAAASAVWNKRNASAGRPGIGFAAPLIYSLATDPTTYERDFHDIQSGSNGFAATPGWDEATGWGTPSFDNLSGNAADVVYGGPAGATEGQTVTLAAGLHDHGTTRGLPGRAVRLGVASESCEALTSAAGGASCAVQLHDRAGGYSATASFAGDAAYTAVSTTQPFTVSAIQSPPSGGPGESGTGASGGAGAPGTTAAPPPGGGASPAATPAVPPGGEQIRAALLSALPGSAGVRLAALRRRGSVRASFDAPQAGEVVISWYWLAKGAHLSTTPLLVGSGRATFAHAGVGPLTIRLTARGRRLLGHVRRLRLTARDTFAPTGQPSRSATKVFVLE